MTVERWLHTLDELQQGLSRGDLVAVAASQPPLDAFSSYHRRLQGLASGCTKASLKLEERLAITGGWQKEVEQPAALLVSPA